MSMSKTSDKKSKKYGVTNVTYKVEEAEEVQMAASNGIPISKTLDSIASLPKDEKLAENVELDFKRSGVLLMANSDAEGGNGDLLFSGNLSLMKKTHFNIPTIEWIPQSDHNSGDEQANGTCNTYMFIIYSNHFTTFWFVTSSYTNHNGQIFVFAFNISFRGGPAILRKIIILCRYSQTEYI